MQLRPLIALASLTILLSSCTPTMQRSNEQILQNEMRRTTDNRGTGNRNGFLPGNGRELSTLPEAQESKELIVRDGDVVTLKPTIVRKKIGGKDVIMYGYNGQIPGPRIRAAQGSTFTVDVTNDIDLPTSIHWHGIRLDNANDGAVGTTQDAIEPGGNFRYTIHVPDEGIYWYHAHLREDIQKPMGLYGAIVVTPKAGNAYARVDREEVVLLNDLLLDSQGEPVPYGRESADHTLMGRFGSTFLVNGRENARLDVALGDVVRFSFINASNTRTYRIVAPAGGKMKLTGGDSGRYEQEAFAESAIIAPGERVIADVEFLNKDVSQGAAPLTVPLVVAGPIDQPSTVLSATITGGVYRPDRTFDRLRRNDDVVASIDPFRPYFAKAPDHTIVLAMNMMGNGMMGRQGMMGSAGASGDGGIEWEDARGMMNSGMMGNMMQWQMIDKATGAANEDLVYQVNVGDTVKFRIINTTDAPHPMQHPIHLHGQRFLVLAENGVAAKNLVWKDTVLVPAGHTVDILVDASNPGDWMFHCHIAEHLSNGMMGMLQVRK